MTVDIFFFYLIAKIFHIYCALNPVDYVTYELWLMPYSMYFKVKGVIMLC